MSGNVYSGLYRLIRIVVFPFIWILDFPAVEKRPNIANFLRYFIYMDYDRRYDEAYVYYKTFVFNLWLNAFFLSMYYVSFSRKIDIDLYLFTIRHRPEMAVDELVYGYPLYVFPILAIATIVYSTILFCFRTTYFSKGRIVRETTPLLDSNKRLYEMKPYQFSLVACGVIFLGFQASSAPWYFREYELYNYAHDFRSQTTENFVVFASAYFVFYQTGCCQMLILSTANLIRRVFNNHLYRKHHK